jgi:hypothetical protein
MHHPSLMAIYRIFFSIVTSTAMVNGIIHRGYNELIMEYVHT